MLFRYKKTYGYIMAEIIKFDFTKTRLNEEHIYMKKLIRIRDEIENHLMQSSLNENDDLAIALAAGRYAAMKLTQLTGEEDTRSFINDCIRTTLNNKKQEL